MGDHKKSVENAMLNFHKKQLGTTREPTRRNKKPEKDVEKAVLEWAKQTGVHLHVIEASSYDARLGRKGLQKAQRGFSDLVGNTGTGHCLYIELKAKDRRGALSEMQRQFLENKIDQHCFAVVVDSVDRLKQYWRGYWSLKTPTEKVAYLKDCMPKKRVSHNLEVKAHPELGF